MKINKLNVAIHELRGHTIDQTYTYNLDIPEYFTKVHEQLNSETINLELEGLKRINIMYDQIGISSVDNSSQSRCD